MDPSGYFFGFFKKLFNAIGNAIGAIFKFIVKNIRTIAAIAAAAVIGPYCAPCAGFVAGMISSGGDLKAGIIGAITGGALSIGNIAVRVAVTAMVGGVGSVIQGGKFLSGFISGGITAGLNWGSQFLKGAFNAGKLIASSIIGGITSELGGGKFINGALWGAGKYLFAHRGEFGENGAGSSGIVRGALDIAGKIWALPNTILGAVYGGIGHVIGEIGNVMGFYSAEPTISFDNNAIQFENNPFAAAGAITIGNTITYGGSQYDPGFDGNIMYLHEMPHTIQSQFMGPFYLPAHAVFGAAAAIFNGSWHGPANILETGPQQHPPQPWW